VADLEDALPLLKAECRLKSETVEKFMKTVYTNMTARTTYDSGSAPRFRTACAFAIVLLKHRDVRRRFDPHEPRYFEAVANYLDARFQPWDSEIAEIAREFIVEYCRAFAAKRVLRFLEGSCRPAHLFLRFAVAAEIGGDVGSVVARALQGEKRKEDVCQALARLLGVGDLPGWAEEVRERIAADVWDEILQSRASYWRL
jgi:hypothetical protein